MNVIDPISESSFKFKDICRTYELESPKSSIFSLTDEGCLFVSPLSMWNNSIDEFAADENIMNKIDSVLLSSDDSTLSSEAETWFRDAQFKVDGHRMHIVGASSAVISFVMDVSTPSRQRLQLYSVHVGGPVFAEFAWKLKEFFETSSTLDMTLIAISFILMHTTVFTLFKNMRSVGSKFSLGFAVLINGTFALLATLVVARILGITLNLIQMSESIPFLVVTIGFEKPFLLTKAILDGFSAEEASREAKSPVRQIVWKGVSEVGPALFTDYMIEIAVLLLRSLSEEGPKKESSYDLSASRQFDINITTAHGSNPFLSRAELILILAFLAIHALGATASNNTTTDMTKRFTSELGGRGGMTSLKVVTPYVLFAIRYENQDGVEQTGYWAMFGHASVWLVLLSALPLFVLIRRIIERFFVARSKVESSPVETEPVKSAKPIVEEKNETVAQSSTLDQISHPDVVFHEVSRAVPGQLRPVEECLAAIKAGKASELDDEEIMILAEKGKVPSYALEKSLAKSVHGDIVNSELPVEHYDHSKVLGQCCENVIGYLPLPVGAAGPILIDGTTYQIPMATTEGCLVVSTSRGCKAITLGGGATTVLVQDSMTRGPVVSFPSLKSSIACKRFIESSEGFEQIETAFNSTSRFAKLKKIKIAMTGRYMYLRFATVTGDAMGMNMISKGVEKALSEIQAEFPDMQIIALSGTVPIKNPRLSTGSKEEENLLYPKPLFRKMFKNLIGSAMAGSIRGFNAHAANILTVVFLATGKDPAQNLESSNCMTLMEKTSDGDLYISCSMPCIEVGTIGGGTQLPAQATCLDILGVRGPNYETPGANSQRLAQIICTAVMAGELSLCCALAGATTTPSITPAQSEVSLESSKQNTCSTTAASSAKPELGTFPALVALFSTAFLIYNRLDRRFFILKDLKFLGTESKTTRNTQTHASQQKSHAVVVGGSWSGLLAARVLLDHFDKVTILESENLNLAAKDWETLKISDNESVSTYPFRKKISQDRHTHTVLSLTLNALNLMFPDFEVEFERRGGRFFHEDELTMFAYGGKLLNYFKTVKPKSRDMRLTASSRVLLENTVRELLIEKYSNTGRLEFRCGVVAQDLVYSDDGQFITGVSVFEGNISRIIACDFVTEASGRANKAVKWLERRNVVVPKKAYEPMIVYSSALFKLIPSNEQKWFSFMSLAQANVNNASLYIYRIENDVAIVTQLSVGKPNLKAAVTDQEFILQAEDAQVPYFESDKEITDGGTKFVPNLLRLFHNHGIGERISKFSTLYPSVYFNRFDLCPSNTLPHNFSVVGDAYVALNPSFGQGLTASVISVVTLDTVLRDQYLRRPRTAEKTPMALLENFSEKFFTLATSRLFVPWTVSSYGDYMIDTIEPAMGDSKSSLMAIGYKWFMRQMFISSRVDPYSNEILYGLFHMTLPSWKLFDVRLYWTLFWTNTQQKRA
ncbi:3-hydroxy-3-methylglutaryl-coenzyme A (HMG-CoA) reductase isozyme [Nowakowskiella sp. JEL0407]|nr:3-hydroxy-3-methylglutaryl-coenzyme A (HMG-CoA) reductase isozyme [Nowakowskiella sp. JEL0407]